ncbi:hypothetical protein ACFQPA_11400 [Halomarina halobia]|uniref:Uncharacterized protein n=1 Tax=Halomarina halobia TaxID=3033386 RepID=A0ABD6AAV5_9EURY|nr:hypothetical protein [Halomarina sp. PSR21]
MIEGVERGTAGNEASNFHLLGRTSSGELTVLRLGGEGFVTRLSGEGHVWLQTRDPTVLYGDGSE